MNDVARVYGTRLIWIELGRPLAKEVEAKDDEPAVDVGLAMSETTNDRVFPRKAAQASVLSVQSLDGIGGKGIGRSWLGFNTAAHGCHIRGIGDAEGGYRGEHLRTRCTCVRNRR